ncbi:MAG: hypothetical protein WBP45_08110 [Daejeonella sp.]
MAIPQEMLEQHGRPAIIQLLLQLIMLIISSATDLSLARTLLHESVHAYLNYSFKYDYSAANLTYGELVDKFLSSKNNIQANTAQHTLIVKNFMNDIALSLKEYATNKGYIITDTNYFTDMAWAALDKTAAYKNLSSQERQRIESRLGAELTNSEVNGYQPKGQKGCN